VELSGAEAGLVTTGPSRDDVYDAMVSGGPPVCLHNIHNPDELAVDPLNLGEREVVIRRLREVLLG
jgi:hypothetical protein